MPKKKNLFVGLMICVILTLQFWVVDAKARDLETLQSDFVELGFGLFACFDIATFLEYAHPNGYEDPNLFNPTALDCGQWADAAKAAHMNYAVLTVKNTGGWCLWDSAYTTHDITQASYFRNGQGDVVREFVDAFRSRGMKVGLYYCFPGDFSKPGVPYQRPVPDGEVNLYGLPPEAIGNEVEFMKDQLTELLVNYAPVDILWIDQYGGTPEWVSIKNYLHTVDPNCLVIGNNAHNFNTTDIISHEKPITYVEQLQDGNTRPSEVCDTMSTWFWKPDLPSSKTVQETVEYLHFCNHNSSNYLYCVPPNREGVIGGFELEHIQAIAQAIDDSLFALLAKAGLDQMLIDVDGNGVEPVVLDGSRSYGPEGDSLTYTWTEGSTVLGTAEIVTVSMPLGPHLITLTVEDSNDGVSSDDVLVVISEQTPLIIDDDVEGNDDAVASIGVITTPWAGWTGSLDLPYLDLLHPAEDDDFGVGDANDQLPLEAINGRVPFNNNNAAGSTLSVTYAGTMDTGYYEVKLQVLNWGNFPFNPLTSVILGGVSSDSAGTNLAPASGDDEIWTYLFYVSAAEKGQPYLLELNFGPNTTISNTGVDHVQIYYYPETVDLTDFVSLAKVWKLDDASPDWDPQYDLVDDGVIDLFDLQVFVEDWIN